MCFLATALWKQTPTGILLSILVYIEYRIALRYEEPFTAEIVCYSSLTCVKHC